MNISLFHPHTQHSYKVAKILYKHNLLLRFKTSFILTPEEEKYVPVFAKYLISNRIINIPAEFLQKDLFFFMHEFFYKKILHQDSLNIHFNFQKIFQERIQDNLIDMSDVIIGFDTCSWLLAERVKNKNKKFILDRSIAHPLSALEIFSMVHKKYPSWQPVQFSNTKEQLFFEQREHELADIITVSGNFVKNSLIENGINEKKIFVNQYGIDIDYFKPKDDYLNNPLTFLFFGAVGTRKGIPVLLNAWRKIAPKNSKLILAGYGEIPINEIIPPNVEILGKIFPNERKSLFERADVFIFPSFFEGFSQSLAEAVVSGLPVITTYNAGGSDIVEDGVNGFLIDPFNEEELAEKIDFFIKNPDKIREMGTSRLGVLRNFLSMAAYENRWLELFSRI